MRLEGRGSFQSGQCCVSPKINTDVFMAAGCGCFMWDVFLLFLQEHGITPMMKLTLLMFPYPVIFGIFLQGRCEVVRKSPVNGAVKVRISQPTLIRKLST